MWSKWILKYQKYNRNQNGETELVPSSAEQESTVSWMGLCHLVKKVSHFSGKCLFFLKPEYLVCVYFNEKPNGNKLVFGTVKMLHEFDNGELFWIKLTTEGNFFKSLF